VRQRIELSKRTQQIIKLTIISHMFKSSFTNTNILFILALVALPSLPSATLAYADATMGWDSDYESDHRIYNDDDDRRIYNSSDFEDYEEDESDDEEEESEDDDDEDDDESVEEVKDETVEKFIRTFHNGDFDTEFDDSLSVDRGVTFLVRSTARPGALYNKPDNWQERNRIGLEKVEEQLEGLFNEVSQDKRFILQLIHHGQDNEEPIVWHEPILDRYWDKVEGKINRRRQLGRVTKIRDMCIRNVEMTKERIAAIVAILSIQPTFLRGTATNSCKVVIFDNVNLCEEGIVCLSKLVDVSSQLQACYLCYNRIDNMDSAHCLSRSLKLHNCINELVMTHCDLGSSPEILSVILQSDVSHIRLSNNNIDSLGAVKIAEYLEGNPPIKVMSLDHNHLNDDDALLISQALKRNTNLEEIMLQTNNLTSIGAKALLTSVFDSSSLNAISESNHTLVGMIMFWTGNNENNDRLQHCIDRMLGLNRMQKILLALQEKESLLQYLANLPVELIPEVLAKRGRIVDEYQHKHLNIVYSTMRWWNMPMLYSYHSCVKSDTKRKRDN